MPSLFIGHGNPMNAVRENAFTKCLHQLGQKIPTPKAIICISAHWMTEGSWVTGMKRPETIHDFYGFPQKLFDVQYNAPGAPELATHINAAITHPKINIDNSEWGLDHGTWSVLTHMYPAANIPVLQLSLDMTKPPEYHLDLGRQLRALRSEGVLIIGSGNIVHNLRKIDFADDAAPFDWAVEFDDWVKNRTEARDYKALLNPSSEAAKLSIPTTEHWLPLLYTLGSAEVTDELKFEYEGIENASISMRCLSFGMV